MPIAKWDPKTSWKDSSNDTNVRRSQRGVGGRKLQGRDSRGSKTPEEVDRGMEYWQGQREHDRERMAHASSSNAGPSRQGGHGHRSTSDSREGKTNQSPYTFGKNTLRDAAEKRKREFAKRTAGAGLEAVEIDDDPPGDAGQGIPEDRFYNTRRSKKGSQSRDPSPEKRDALKRARGALASGDGERHVQTGRSNSPEKKTQQKRNHPDYVPVFNEDNELLDDAGQPIPDHGPSKRQTRSNGPIHVLDDSEPDQDNVAGPSQQTPPSGSTGRAIIDFGHRTIANALNRIPGFSSPSTVSSPTVKDKGKTKAPPQPKVSTTRHRPPDEELLEPIEDGDDSDIPQPLGSRFSAANGTRRAAESARRSGPPDTGKGKNRARHQDSDIVHVEQPRGQEKPSLLSRMGDQHIPSSRLGTTSTRRTSKIASVYLDVDYRLDRLHSLISNSMSVKLQGAGNEFIRIRFEELKTVTVCTDPGHALFVAQVDLRGTLSKGTQVDLDRYCEASRGRPNYEYPFLCVEMAENGHHAIAEFATHVAGFQPQIPLFQVESYGECQAAKFTPPSASEPVKRRKHDNRSREPDGEREERANAADKRARQQKAKGTGNKSRDAEPATERKLVRPRRSDAADPNQSTLPFQRESRQHRIDNAEYGNASSTSMPGGFPAPTRRSVRSHAQKSTGMFVGMDSEDDGDTPVASSRPEAPPPRVKPPTDKNEFLFSYPEGTGSIAITAGDLYRIESLDFLNDTLIEFGLRHAIIDWKVKQPIEEADANKEGKEYEQPLIFADDVHLFNSFFYEKLSTKGTMKYNPETESWPAYESVKKWTRNKHIFDKKLILVPINENMHWYLAVIYRPSGVLRKIDPEPEAEGDDGGPATATRSKDAKDQGSEGLVESLVDVRDGSSPLSELPAEKDGQEGDQNEKEEKEETEEGTRRVDPRESPGSDLSSESPNTKMKGRSPTPAVGDDDGTIHAGDITDGRDPLDVMEEDVKQMDPEVEVMSQQMDDVRMEDPSADEAEAPNAPLQTMTMLAVKHQDGTSASRPTTPLPTGVQNAAAVQESPTGRSKRVSPGVQILNGEECWIFTFDSLGGAHKPANEILGRWLQFEARDKRQFEGAIQKPSYREARVPQQPNFSDCGLFLVHYARQFMERTQDILKQIEEGVPFTGNPARHDFDFRVNKTWKNEETRDLRTTWESLIDSLCTPEYRAARRDRGLPSRPNPPGESAANGANPLAAEQSTDDIQLLSQDPRKSEGAELPSAEQEVAGDVPMEEGDHQAGTVDQQAVDSEDIDPALLKPTRAARKTRSREKVARDDDTQTIGSSSEDETVEQIESKDPPAESMEEEEKIEQFSDPVPAGQKSVGMAREESGSRSKSKEPGMSKDTALDIYDDDEGDEAVASTTPAPVPVAPMEDATETVISPKGKGRGRRPLGEIEVPLSSPKPEQISAGNLTREDLLSPQAPRATLAPSPKIHHRTRAKAHEEDEISDGKRSPVKQFASPFADLANRGRRMLDGDKEQLHSDSWMSQPYSDAFKHAPTAQPSPSFPLRSGAALAGSSTGGMVSIDHTPSSSPAPASLPPISGTIDRSSPEDIDPYLGEKLDSLGRIVPRQSYQERRTSSRQAMMKEKHGSPSPPVEPMHRPRPSTPGRSAAEGAFPQDEEDELSSSPEAAHPAAAENNEGHDEEHQQMVDAKHGPQYRVTRVYQPTSKQKGDGSTARRGRGNERRHQASGRQPGTSEVDVDMEKEEEEAESIPGLVPLRLGGSSSKRAGSRTSPVQPAKKSKRVASSGTPAGHKILDERGDSLNPIELEDSDEDK